MKFKKIILIVLLLLAIFTISSVSANGNASDTISTEQDNDELKTIGAESENNVGKYAENDTFEEFSSNLIGQSDDNLLSQDIRLEIRGNTTIEKGEIAEFTIQS